MLRVPVLTIPLVAVACTAAGTGGIPAAHPSGGAVTRWDHAVVQQGDPETSAARARGPSGAEDRPLTLEEAWRLAERNSPELVALDRELAAQGELMAVSGRLPDARLFARAESVPFSSPRSGEEIVAGVSQPLPIGGRLAAGEALAEGRLELLHARRHRVAVALETRLRGAFATVLSLQEARETQAGRLALAREWHALATAEVDAGARVPGELVAPRLRVAELSQELAELDHRLQAARQQLDALIGGGERRPRRLEASLDEVLELPVFHEVLDRVSDMPAVRESVAEVRVAELEAARSAAERIPVVNLDLFYRRRSDDRASFDAGISLELPLSGAAAARARAARERAAAAVHRESMARRDATLELRRRHAEVARALARLESYRREVLPALEMTLAMARTRQEAGDISRLELLPVEDEASRARLAHFDAWHEFLSAWAALAPLLRAK